MAAHNCSNQSSPAEKKPRKQHMMQKDTLARQCTGRFLFPGWYCKNRQAQASLQRHGRKAAGKPLYDRPAEQLARRCSSLLTQAAVPHKRPRKMFCSEVRRCHHPSKRRYRQTGSLTRQGHSHEVVYLLQVVCVVQLLHHLHGALARRLACSTGRHAGGRGLSRGLVCGTVHTWLARTDKTAACSVRGGEQTRRANCCATATIACKCSTSPIGSKKTSMRST